MFHQSPCNCKTTFFIFGAVKCISCLQSWFRWNFKNIYLVTGMSRKRYSVLISPVSTQFPCFLQCHSSCSRMHKKIYKRNMQYLTVSWCLKVSFEVGFQTSKQILSNTRICRTDACVFFTDPSYKVYSLPLTYSRKSCTKTIRCENKAIGRGIDPQFAKCYSSSIQKFTVL